MVSGAYSTSPSFKIVGFEMRIQLQQITLLMSNALPPQQYRWEGCFFSTHALGNANIRTRSPEEIVGRRNAGPDELARGLPD
jgi:hypothetical protein